MDYKYKVGDVLYHKGSGRYGKVRKLAITDNGKKLAYKVINIDNHQYTKWSESRVQLREAIPPIEWDIDEVLENTIDITLDNIGVDDYIVIKTIEQFKSDGISFKDNNNPIVNPEWDSNKKMQKFFGKTIKVVKDPGTGILAETWVWSLDCIYKIIKKDEPIDTSDIYDEMDKPEEVEKPKPITYKPMSVREEIIAMMPTPILLEGPVGTLKTTTLMDLAKELKLVYYAMILTNQTSASEFKGYKNVIDGSFIMSDFRKAYENGGLFVLDEINNGDPNLLVIFNSITNGYFTFADKLIYAHKDFRLFATMNTITNSHEFQGRKELDLSTKDRFHTIKMEEVPLHFLQKETRKIIKYIDDKFKANGITKNVTIREALRYEKLCEVLDNVQAVEKTMLKGLVKIDRTTLEAIIKDYYGK